MASTMENDVTSGEGAAPTGVGELSAILETAHEAFISMDAGGFITDWNPEAERTFGWSREEALGKVLADTIIPPQHRAAHWAGLKRFIATGNGPVLDKRIEITALHREGFEFPVEMTISSTGTRAKPAFHAFLHDVSERKLREAELKASQAQLAQAQRLAHIGSWEWDIEGDEVRWSDELYRIYGLRPDDDVGGYRGFLERVHPDDRAMVDEAVRTARQQRSSFDFEHRIVRPDGATRVLNAVGELVVDEQGTPVRIAGTGHDVTERKETEEALRRTRERDRLLLESVTDYAIYMLGLDGRVLSWNPGAERMTGYSAEEVLGHDYSVFHLEADAEAGRPRRILELAAERGHYEEEGWRVRKDGTRFWATVVVNAMRDEDGRLRGFSKVIRDITERKQARDEALLARELAIAVSEAETVDEAFAVTLRKICDKTGWVLGQVWVCDGETQRLHCSPAWHATCEGLEPFRRGSESLTLERSVGLPGRAWEAGEPVWLKDVSSDANFPRAPFAREVGLGAGMAVPVRAGENIVAVMEFFVFESRAEDERHINLVSAAATHIGMLIKKKETESQLKQSEERFRLLVESIEDHAMFLLDPEGQVTSWNVGAERVTGYSREEILGYHFSRFYTPEAVEEGQPEQHLDLAVEAGSHEQSDWRERKDGLRFWAAISITPLRDETGELRGFSHAIGDMSERKHAEEELRRLGSIVENSDDAVISTTPGRGIITSWNAGAERLFGYSAREVIGRAIGLIVPPDRREAQTRILDRVLAGQRVQHYETQSLRKDGSLVDISLTVSPIRDLTGAIAGVSAIARDITDLKRAQRFVEEAFGTYVDRDVANQILERGSLLTPEEVDVTVMFVDIRDFTGFTDRTNASDVVRKLNELFELIVPIVAERHGHIDKFIGDGLLAVFGGPWQDSDGEPDNAACALDAALEIERSVRAQFGEELRIGIGMDSGRVIAGNIGGPGRLDFTVIGNAVNMAARVEAATRETGDPILMTDRTQRLLGTADVSLAKRAGIRFKGMRDPIDLFAPGCSSSSSPSGSDPPPEAR
jgi:PAS domain S-box-containing protein